MRILGLLTENVKRVAVVAIEPSGNMIEITGENGAGKTSTIDSIVIALNGAAAMPPEVIKAGKDKAKIIVTLGEANDRQRYIVTKTITRREGGVSVTLRVENEDGASVTNPQTILKRFIGALSFDPMAFMAMKPTEQYETLEPLVTGVKMADIDALNDKDYGERTLINRQADSAKTRAAAIVITSEMVARTDEEALVAELTRAMDHNAGISREAQERDFLKTETRQIGYTIKSWRDDADKLRKQLADLEGKIDSQTFAYNTRIEAEEKWQPLGEPINQSDIRDRIAAARAGNKQFDDKVRLSQEKQRLEDEATRFEAQSAMLTAGMKARDKQKQDAVAAAKLPIPGIGFGDKIILLGGFPLSEASHAQQIHASVAIAAAMNPRLRIAFVRDGALLSETSWGILCKIAEELNVQVWAETVNSKRPGAVIIEDGMVKGN